MFATYRLNNMLFGPKDEDEIFGGGPDDENEEQEDEEEESESESDDDESDDSSDDDEEKDEDGKDDDSDEDEDGDEDESSSTGVSASQIESIASAVAAGLVKTQNQNGNREQPQLTEEQVDKLLNRYKASEDALRSIGIAEPTEDNVKAFQAIVDNVVKNANTATKVMLQAELAKLTPQIEAVQAVTQEAQTERVRKQFFDKYPELEPYEKIVKAVSSGLDEKTVSSMTLEQGMQHVSKEVKQILKNSGITLKKKKAGTDEQATNRGAGSRVPAMASMSGSGRSSTGGSKSNKNNPDADIYKNWD